MVAPALTIAQRRQRGSSMIEVLVTLVIVSFGLLGLAGLQTRLQTSEMESYQRSQALLLLNDMANRITTNRSNAAAYVSGADVDSPLGAGMNCPTSTASVVEADLREWCNALQGAGETTGGNNVGAMIGGRGCVEDLGSGEYFITVAWQGLIPIAAPPASVACGANGYDTAGSSCVNDLCRRTVTTLVRIATL
ncbi:type IV pilus modification protein PilV [Rhodoferax sp.]|uniref:type IV pilus modification protein PilV n=1 Tax=Rhodoferax sp. TaxID=50421 RepID=UPI00271C5AD2|nr:type IV pilus modification protein PilV [Rhodoferax sp.]MDO9143885.1 type IV pilus modification protein PilV [Rhodoferax sp.]